MTDQQQPGTPLDGADERMLNDRSDYQACFGCGARNTGGLQLVFHRQQALMDLGATICIARRPACERCPLASACAAWEEASATALFPSGEAITRLRDERAQTAITASPPGSVAEASASYQITAPARPRRAPQPFIGGARYYRGRIVHALREAPPDAPLTLAELGARIKGEYTESDEPWLRSLVDGLARDGLARVIPAEHDGPPTDAIRVALP